MLKEHSRIFLRENYKYINVFRILILTYIQPCYLECNYVPVQHCSDLGKYCPRMLSNKSSSVVKREHVTRPTEKYG